MRRPWEFLSSVGSFEGQFTLLSGILNGPFGESSSYQKFSVSHFSPPPFAGENRDHAHVNERDTESWDQDGKESPPLLRSHWMEHFDKFVVYFPLHSDNNRKKHNRPEWNSHYNSIRNGGSYYLSRHSHKTNRCIPIQIQIQCQRILGERIKS